MIRVSRVVATVSVACVGLLLAGCSTVTEGHAVSPLYDPFRAGGLPAEDGPSGIRADAPEPTGDVTNTDGGDVDRLTLLAVNDVTDFWQQNYSSSLNGTFEPIERLQSYDSKDPSSPAICGTETYDEPNAFYCPSRKIMAWDRGAMVPTGRDFFGDVSIGALMAHEYGHAVQHMAGIVDDDTPVIVSEQQADCFAGTYIRWVAEGQSPRFSLSTGDGLNHVLAAAITLRDPILGPQDTEMLEEGHGTALDRVSAFQMGFVGGAPECAKIDLDEIEERRGDLPMELPLDDTGDVQSGEVPIDEDTLDTLMEVLGEVYKPSAAPTLAYGIQPCLGVQPSPPATYCPDSNTISVDLPALQKLGEADNESNYVLLQGDNSALSVLTSRYALAMQHENGDPLDTPVAALRTACLTGVAQRAMADPLELPSGKSLMLTAGDLDEAVSGLLTNGLAASNVDGKTVPAGFTRIIAYRSGLTGGRDLCYSRFK
ncbi:neutral zinc metallopeptidase [Mycobacterium sp. URHB0044]|uniref:neutral zinc metallopeptidase n=1 Tax=Mycobacterium sp. URHB0044 TaxID=1380386 RepID=UPI00048BFADB|nr:neutral zinc metallopeptidase [Mycobacterium sp. URHB0044]